MSFAGEYATYARLGGVELAVVLEIDLNDATWDPGDGNLATTLYLSDRAVKARSRSYDPRVVRGGWSGLRQRIEIRAAGLSGLGTSVIVADADNRVRDALVNGDNRNSTAAIYRVIPGSDDDYDTRFTGILDSWEFSPGQVRLNLKTDERNLKSYQPAWPYLKSEWFQMSDEFVGKYIPLVYGKHDSTGLNLDHGMIPTVPAWLGANAWYGSNLAPAAWIKDVYVDGTKEAAANYSAVYGSYAGGKIVTMVEYVSSFPAIDATVTVDLYGYPWTTPSNYYDDGYAGQTVITNPVEQLRHFLVNFAVDRTKGYIPGDWNDTATIIDGTSWDAAASWATSHGLEGARYLQDPRTVGSVVTEWCQSFPMFRPFWNTEGKIEMRVLSASWPGYWDGSSDIIRREDCIGNTFSYEIYASDVTGRISIEYLYDSVQNQFLRSLDVQDLSVNELSDMTLSMYWAPSRQV